MQIQVYASGSFSMPYESQLDRACAEIDAARVAVSKAQEAYSKGGGIDSMNHANRRLADAHDAYRACAGLRVPDRR
jgi:hypothetical protein